MKKLIIIALLTGGLILSNIKAETTIDKPKEFYINLFKKDYQNPVVSTYKSSLNQIVFCSVYEKAWEAEDPLIPILYAVSEDGKKFKASESEITNILKYIQFNPKTQKDVLAAVEFYFQLGPSTRMVQNKPEEQLKNMLPESVLLQVKPISIIKNADTYKVLCFGLSNNSREVMFRRKPINYQLYEINFTLSKNLCQVQRKLLWKTSINGKYASEDLRQ